jgi:hypothetical protein
LYLGSEAGFKRSNLITQLALANLTYDSPNLVIAKRRLIGVKRQGFTFVNSFLGAASMERHLC